MAVVSSARNRAIKESERLKKETTTTKVQPTASVKETSAPVSNTESDYIQQKRKEILDKQHALVKERDNLNVKDFPGSWDRKRRALSQAKSKIDQQIRDLAYERSILTRGADYYNKPSKPDTSFKYNRKTGRYENPTEYIDKSGIKRSRDTGKISKKDLKQIDDKKLSEIQSRELTSKDLVNKQGEIELTEKTRQRIIKHDANIKREDKLNREKTVGIMLTKDEATRAGRAMLTDKEAKIPKNTFEKYQERQRYNIAQSRIQRERFLKFNERIKQDKKIKSPDLYIAGELYKLNPSAKTLAQVKKEENLEIIRTNRTDYLKSVPAALKYGMDETNIFLRKNVVDKFVPKNLGVNVSATGQYIEKLSAKVPSYNLGFVPDTKLTVKKIGAGIDVFGKTITGAQEKPGSTYLRFAAGYGAGGVLGYASTGSATSATISKGLSKGFMVVGSAGLVQKSIYLSQIENQSVRRTAIADEIRKGVATGAGVIKGYKVMTAPKISTVTGIKKQVINTRSTGVNDGAVSMQPDTTTTLRYNVKYPFRKSVGTKLQIKPSGNIIKTESIGTNLKRVTTQKPNDIMAKQAIFQQNKLIGKIKKVEPISLEQISPGLGERILRQNTIETQPTIKTTSSRSILKQSASQQNIIDLRTTNIRGQIISGQKVTQTRVAKFGTRFQTDTLYTGKKIYSDVGDISKIKVGIKIGNDPKEVPTLKIKTDFTEYVPAGVTIKQTVSSVPQLTTRTQIVQGTRFKFDYGTFNVPSTTKPGFKVSDTLSNKLKFNLKESAIKLNIRQSLDTGVPLKIKDISSISISPRDLGVGMDQVVARPGIIPTKSQSFMNVISKATGGRPSVMTVPTKQSSVMYTVKPASAAMPVQDSFKIPSYSSMIPRVPTADLSLIGTTTSLNKPKTKTGEMSQFVPGKSLLNEQQSITLPMEKSKSISDTKSTIIQISKQYSDQNVRQSIYPITKQNVKQQTKQRTKQSTTQITDQTFQIDPVSPISTPAITPIATPIGMPPPTPPPFVPGLWIPKREKRTSIINIKPKKPKQKFRYTPTLFSTIGGIKAPSKLIKPRSTRTGLGIRPILEY